MEKGDIMQAIIDFLVGFGKVILSLADFAYTFIYDLVYVIKLTARSLAAIPALFYILPGACVTLLVGIFSVVVIYKVLGREG